MGEAKEHELCGIWRKVVLPRLGYGWLGSAFDGSEAVA